MDQKAEYNGFSYSQGNRGVDPVWRITNNMLNLMQCFSPSSGYRIVEFCQKFIRDIILKWIRYIILKWIRDIILLQNWVGWKHLSHLQLNFEGKPQTFTVHFWKSFTFHFWKSFTFHFWKSFIRRLKQQVCSRHHCTICWEHMDFEERSSFLENLEPFSWKHRSGTWEDRVRPRSLLHLWPPPNRP